MKTTLEIPDAIFHRAKARAAEQRVPLREFISEAVAEKLDAKSPPRGKARMKLAEPAALAKRNGPNHPVDGAGVRKN